MSDPWDVLVVGGGVVGAAIAREFSSSGRRVLLCEKEEEVASISFQNTKGLNFRIETEQTQVLGGASGANTGHFASFFYYTRARALLEGELAAQVEEMLFIDYFLFLKIFCFTFQARKINPGWLAGQPAVPRLDTGAWKNFKFWKKFEGLANEKISCQLNQESFALT